MSTVDTIVAKLPMQELAARLVLPDTAIRQAVQLAVPTLMGAMKANAESEPGAASLSAALQQHEVKHTDDHIALDVIDTEEGDGIVGNLLGDQREDVAERLGRVSGDVDAAAFLRLFPLIAPVVMSQLSRETGGGDPAQLSKKLAALANGSSGGRQIQNMLGDLLGGGKR